MNQDAMSACGDDALVVLFPTVVLSIEYLGSVGMMAVSLLFLSFRERQAQRPVFFL